MDFFIPFILKNIQYFHSLNKCMKHVLIQLNIALFLVFTSVAQKRVAIIGGGTQLVLDLGNPKVQDFVFGVVDDLLTKYPEIAYIKWDANMAIMNHGSQYLSAADQSHLYIAYHQGFAKVIDRIRAKYKNVIIQCCASGGARANWGCLRGFDEFWVSDNTDALQRIYM